MGRRKKGGSHSFLEIVLIIVGVLLLVLIIADALENRRERKKTDAEKLQDLKELREKYNSGIKRSVRNEFWIYFIARTIIVGLIVGLNLFFYFSYYSNLHWENALAHLMNINEALILIYSFIAFMIYGTPSKFVKGIRQVIYRWRKRRNLPANLDIDQLEKEIAALEAKIKADKNKPDN
ncbi:MAG: hypothetical protein HWE22_17415 [Flavobacteriales bacterium]|nr:hypothetical protein [Flavobacteriales bacterium]